MNKPQAYEYLNAREFLRDLVEYSRTAGQYTVRKFAKELGLGSSNYIRLIIDGKRTLSAKMTEKVIHGFSIRGSEAKYFECLVDFTQAKTTAERDHHWKAMLKYKGMRAWHEISVQQYKFYTNWRIPVLLESLRTEWASKSRFEIAKKMMISETELNDYIENLRTLGFLEGDDRTWQVKTAISGSAHETDSLNVRGFHRMIIQKALNTLDQIPTDQRKLGGLTIALSEEAFEEVKMQINEFFEGLNEKYGSLKRAKKVYQVETQLFPLLDLVDDKVA